MHRARKSPEAAHCFSQMCGCAFGGHLLEALLTASLHGPGRRQFLKGALLTATSSLVPLPVRASGEGSLQELSAQLRVPPEATIYTAREIVTLDPSKPTARAVAVIADRILAVGDVDDLRARIGAQPYRIDETFADHVIVPGFIAQHVHPFLAALTLESEIIAIEDWALPSGTVAAVRDQAGYVRRLKEAEARLADPPQPLLTWGYHHYFHGKLALADLDNISATRPIMVWHRSAHEFILNTPALVRCGIDAKSVAAMPASARQQTNLQEGHFWEQGLLGLLPKLAPVIATPERLRSGLELMSAYCHCHGVTLACEPGGLSSKPLQDAINAIMGSPAMPFRFYFVPDGKSLAQLYEDGGLVAETEKTLSWGQGMTRFLPKQVKLFADGAMFSQLMRMREGYLDGHQGEWMMDPDLFAKAFRTYWDAGYQIHVHQNGDAGLDMVLDNLEADLRRNPRSDHRTTVVHFGFSTREQVQRIAALGAIVSANPYYTTALADRYGEMGIGPQRADEMTRLGDVERAGIPFSLHSDMPMAPEQPLFLMHCAVNRTTFSGRVAGPQQRVSRLGALRGVTIEAAYSYRLENEVGSIEPGKCANLSILADNPLTVDPGAIKDIKVWGTIHEGRKLPVGPTLAIR